MVMARRSMLVFLIAALVVSLSGADLVNAQGGKSLGGSNVFDFLGAGVKTHHDGALLALVPSYSPAAAAGLKAGDVITAVNGQPVDAEHALADRVAAYQEGDTLALTVLRDGEMLTLEVTLSGFDIPIPTRSIYGPASQGALATFLRNHPEVMHAIKALRSGRINWQELFSNLPFLRHQESAAPRPQGSAYLPGSLHDIIARLTRFFRSATVR